MNPQEQQYALHNPENFRNSINHNSVEICSKYITIIIEYLKFSVENTTNIKPQNCLNYIIVRGIETLTNVFNNILFFTKNLGITFFHSQKAYYFYIEFIGQISGSQNTFLQLSSRDATLYVYKKTLYELHNDLKRNIVQTKEDATKLDILQKNGMLFKNIINTIINKNDFSNANSLETKITTIDKLEKICNQINKLTNSINVNGDIVKTTDKINVMYNFVDNIGNNETLNTEKYLDILELYFKKASKNIDLINHEYSIKKIIDLNFNDKLTYYCPNDFVNYLFN